MGRIPQARHRGPRRDVLRGRHRDRLRGFRRPGYRDRGHRGRARRTARQHQRGPAGRVRGDPYRAGSPEIPGRHARGDRGGKGLDRQAGRPSWSGEITPGAARRAAPGRGARGPVARSRRQPRHPRRPRGCALRGQAWDSPVSTSGGMPRLPRRCCGLCRRHGGRGPTRLPPHSRRPESPDAWTATAAGSSTWRTTRTACARWCGRWKSSTCPVRCTRWSRFSATRPGRRCSSSSTRSSIGSAHRRPLGRHAALGHGLAPPMAEGTRPARGTRGVVPGARLPGGPGPGADRSRDDPGHRLLPYRRGRHGGTRFGGV